MRKLLPILLALIGLGAGVGGGFALRPPPEDLSLGPCGDPEAEVKTAAPGPAEGEEAVPTHDYVKLNNQFVVPVVDGGRVSALVILSINLEVTVGGSEQVYAREPKLRDAFLQVLFDHANSGGFNGAFTEANKMSILRMALLEAAKRVLADTVSDILISDILRQDT